MLASFWQKESKFCSISYSAWVMSIEKIIQFQSIIIYYSLRVTIQRDYSDTSWVSNLSYTLKVILRPIYTVRLCRMRQAYDRPTTRIVSCKSNLPLAYDCRARHEKCRRILGYFFKHYSPVSVWQKHQFATFNPPLYQLKSGTISLFRQSPLYLKDISTK